MKKTTIIVIESIDTGDTGEQISSNDEQVIETYLSTRGGNEFKKVSFNGKLLARTETETLDEDGRGTIWSLYQTKKGKFLLHWKYWSKYEGEIMAADYVVLNDFPACNAEYEGEVLGTLSDPVPGDLVSEARETVNSECIKKLDI